MAQNSDFFVGDPQFFSEVEDARQEVFEVREVESDPELDDEYLEWLAEVNQQAWQERQTQDAYENYYNGSLYGEV